MILTPSLEAFLQGKRPEHQIHTNNFNLRKKCEEVIEFIKALARSTMTNESTVQTVNTTLQSIIQLINNPTSEPTMPPNEPLSVEALLNDWGMDTQDIPPTNIMQPKTQDTREK